MPVYQVKRIYDVPQTQDGYRVLIDRLWPRGISKETAAIDIWLKDIAPSSELRQWFGHRADRFEEFAVRYQSELDANVAAEELRQLARQHRTVTLLYAAKDPVINQAVVLQRYLKNKA